MHTIETLDDGSSRLSGKRCSFVFKRLQPGVLLTAVQGADDGEFDQQPLALVDAEWNRFRLPLRWYIDARLAPNAAVAVLDTWTAWLRRSADRLASLQVLVANDVLASNIDIARYLSQLHQGMTIHRDPDRFFALLQQEGGAAYVPDTSCFGRPSIAITVAQGKNNTLCLEAPTCSYEFRRLPEGIVLTTVRGDEGACLGNLAMDHLDAQIDLVGDKVGLRMDLGEVKLVAPQQPAIWTAWMTARESRFRDIVVYAPGPIVRLFLLGTQYRLKTRHLMRIVDDASQFRRSMGHA